MKILVGLIGSVAIVCISVYEGFTWGLALDASTGMRVVASVVATVAIILAFSLSVAAVGALIVLPALAVVKRRQRTLFAAQLAAYYAGVEEARRAGDVRKLYVVPPPE